MTIFGFLMAKYFYPLFAPPPPLGKPGFEQLYIIQGRAVTIPEFSESDSGSGLKSAPGPGIGSIPNGTNKDSFCCLNVLFFVQNYDV